MSLMIDGELHPDWLAAESEDGEFVRRDSVFRHWITPDGRPGPDGEGGFPAAAGRYHLYVSYACPWAHRSLIARRLKGLEGLIGVSVVSPYMGELGWSFEAYPGATGDRVNGDDHLYQTYLRADPYYSGIVTVPALYDCERGTLVNNESADIIRMFDTAFDGLTGSEVRLCPPELAAEIDALNARIYEAVNDGVYRAGFAGTQGAYERAFDTLFAMLDELDARLAGRRFLLGSEPTEADWRLFPTLLRFDPVYYSHFKCNARRIADYPHLAPYLRDLYQWPGIAETVDLDHVKQHYYWSHPEINPTRIVPKGPVLDLAAPHDRERLGA